MVGSVFLLRYMSRRFARVFVQAGYISCEGIVQGAKDNGKWNLIRAIYVNYRAKFEIATEGRERHNIYIN